MKKNLRTLLLTLSVIGLATGAATHPAFAFYKHHHKHYVHRVVRHTVHHKHKAVHHKTSTLLRDAQNSLINLQYLHGNADGIMGPKTIKAIKAFQKEHGLPVTGTLTKQTYNAIIKADSQRAMAGLPIPADKLNPLAIPMVNPHKDTLTAQPGLTGPTNQDYADPLRGGKTTVDANGGDPAREQSYSSRYAKLDVSERNINNLRRYNFQLNGTPLLEVNNQPSIIGVSQTYALDNEDVIILTSYNADDNVCAYKHFLLTLSQGRNELLSVGNCTHGYQARKVEDSVFITFPEFDDERLAGATWRYENGDLEKL